MKKKIDKMSGIEFENYLYYLFLNLGYEVERTPESIDYGADLIIIKDRIKTVVQAKRYNTPVGVSAVQEVLGAKGYYNASKTLVVTNSDFTTNAKELAKKNDVQLWGRRILYSKIITEDELFILMKKDKKIIIKKQNSFNENIDIIINTIFKKY